MNIIRQNQKEKCIHIKEEAMTDDEQINLFVKQNKNQCCHKENQEFDADKFSL